jgi:hypothetical protein
MRLRRPGSGVAWALLFSSQRSAFSCQPLQLGTWHEISEKSAVGSRGSEDRWFEVLNIEQQNKEPQNDDVITSIFEIPCSTFCGSNRQQLR